MASEEDAGRAATADASQQTTRVDGAVPADGFVPPVAAHSGSACVSAADCVDGIDCTADLCSNGRCTHPVDESVCSETQSCDLQRGGCVTTVTCAQGGFCVAPNLCTTGWRCNNESAHCQWTLVDLDRDGHVSQDCGGDDFDDMDDTRYLGAPDICNAKDNDNDGIIDEQPDADASCVRRANAVATCNQGVCRYACHDNYGDCDGDPLTGCETYLVDNPDHCGTCDNQCPPCTGDCIRCRWSQCG